MTEAPPSTISEWPTTTVSRTSSRRIRFSPTRGTGQIIPLKRFQEVDSLSTGQVFNRTPWRLSASPRASESSTSSRPLAEVQAMIGTGVMSF